MTCTALLSLGYSERGVTVELIHMLEIKTFFKYGTKLKYHELVGKDAKWGYFSEVTFQVFYAKRISTYQIYK